MTIHIAEGISPRIKNLYIFRQALATFASCLLSMAGGLTFGYTAILLPQLEKEKDYPYDKEYDSWIASISPLAMIFGCLFSGPISDAIGRKKGQMLLTFPFMLGWIIIGVATNNAGILVGRFITGLCTGAIRPLGMVYISEISDPKYRAITLFCPGLSIQIGGFISHAITNYISRKIACFVFIVPLISCFILLLFLNESPLWLITKGQKERGIESFTSFRGDGPGAQQELKTVLESADPNAGSPLKDFLEVVCTKPFIKSLSVMFFVFVAVQMCGINTISFYAQSMFESTFGKSIDSFMLMLVNDCIRMASATLVCLVANKLPRRGTFLFSCYCICPLLLGLVAFLHFKPEGMTWAGVTCLITYIAIASILTSISWSFVAEIFPNKVRGIGSGISSMLSFSLLFLSVKVTPDIRRHFGEGAMYGSFATLSLVAGIVLTFILPETNGKSLQDIENSMYNKNNVKPAADIKMNSQNASPA